MAPYDPNYGRGNGNGNDPRDPRSDRGGGAAGARRDERQDDRGGGRRDDRDDRGNNGGAPDKKKRTQADLKIPQGDYIAICVSHTFGLGPAGEQIGVACKIVEGECTGQVRTWYGSFSPAAMEYTLRGMKAFGHKGSDILDCSTMYPENGGTPARITIEHDQYDGEWREKVAFVSGEGVAMKKPLEGAALMRFQERMRGVLGRGGAAHSADGGYGRGGNAPAPQGSRDAPPAQRNFNEAAPQGGRGNGGGNGRDEWDDEEAPPPGEPPPQRGGYGRGGR